jgi:hypothetical protein
MNMRSNQKKGESKEGKKDGNPERARKVVHGSSNSSNAPIIFMEEVDMPTGLNEEERPLSPATLRRMENRKALDLADKERSDRIKALLDLADKERSDRIKAKANNDDVIFQKLGSNKNSELVESNKQTTGDEGKGTSNKQTPGDNDEESESTMPIPKKAGNDIDIEMLKDIFETNEDYNDDLSSQEDYRKNKPAPNKGAVKHQLENSQKNLEKNK